MVKVSSNYDFKIRQSRDHLSYIEGDYAVRIPRHVVKLQTPHTVMYDFNQLEDWFPPNQNEPITKDKIKKIMRRVEEWIRRSLNQKGYEYEIKRLGQQVIATQKAIDHLDMVKENKRQLKERIAHCIT